MVIELLRGTVLKDVLKLPECQTIGRKLHLMMQLSSGLGAAHRASVFHRDIKPSNVFVRADGLLKILDFGVARLGTSNITAAGFVVGTPDYMSPEQARGEEIDGRSDIFSMGGVFYFMLTGRKPFGATALLTLFHQIQSEDPAPLDGDVPPELASVVMKALAKNRDVRYQSCEEVLADLQLVQRLYPIDAADLAPLQLTSVAGAEEGPADGSRTRLAAAPSDGRRAAPSTEDTMDFDPRASIHTDETVSLAPPTWTSRFRAGVGAALAGVSARLSRPGVPAATRHASRVKR